ncbi:MAG: efflux RND transporter periplasmic adaptor subunit [candidate division Zixibacteria bacterium]|nr:efflux RND transporter periplasmic adaptor subunit [candidate division Zixibacteria bacterium]
MFRKPWFWVVLGVVVVGVVLAFARSNRKEKNGAATLKIARVTRGNLLASITATGIARPIQTVELKSKASGEIIALPIDAGDYVKKGDLICKLDQTTAKNDHEQAKADYEVGLAAEKKQKKEFDRILELFEKKLVSEVERDNAELAYQQAHSQRVRAEAALSTAAERLAETELKAPIDGIILRKDVEAGQVISSGVSSVSGGTTIALLANLDKVNVLADVDETDIGRVKVGQTVKAVADAFPDQEFVGRVLKVAPLAKVEQNVTTFEVTAEVDNPRHLLKSGMNANVQIMTAEARNVLLVPNEAVKELMDVMQYFSEEEQKKFATMMDGENRSRTSPAGGSGGQQVIVMQGGPGGGGSGRAGGGNRQVRRNFDPSKMDTTKMGPETRARMREFSAKRAERKAKGDSAGVEATPRWVLVKEKDKITPKQVLAGISNLDNTEIISGLSEGKEVIAQPTSMLAKEREAMMQRFRSFGGIPGMSGGSGTSGRR